MKRFYLVMCLMLSAIIVGCGNKTSVTNELTYGSTMINSFEKVFSNKQFDSICKADVLSNDLKTGWQSAPYKDGETNESFNEYLFIKGKTIYRAIKVGNDSIKITKRIIK